MKAQPPMQAEPIEETEDYELHADGRIAERGTGRLIVDLPSQPGWESDPRVPIDAHPQIEELAQMYSHFRVHGVTGFEVTDEDRREMMENGPATLEDFGYRLGDDGIPRRVDDVDDEDRDPEGPTPR